MKKEHCVLILICCFLMAACGRLEDIPEDLSAFPETERKETAETPAGPQFETLTVADDPITAEFSLTTRQEPAAFLYVAVEKAQRGCDGYSQHPANPCKHSLFSNPITHNLPRFLANHGHFLGPQLASN